MQTKDYTMSRERYLDCIDACYECAIECENCATACLREDDTHALTRCINLNRYCAEICRTTAAFLSRGDLFAEQITALCADICDVCAEESGKFQTEHCQICADTCRNCAVECRDIE